MMSISQLFDNLIELFAIFEYKINVIYNSNHFYFRLIQVKVVLNIQK